MGKQWPLTIKKLQALKQLVQEQPDAQHIKEPTSPCNYSVFVVKKMWKMENGDRSKSC